MVSPGRRREAVAHLERTRGVSERRACRVVDQPRSTQRYRATIKDDEPRVVARMRALVREHPRFGYRRIHALLRREGFRINRKRVWRLWKREGFKVPRRVRKPRGPGVSAHAVHRRPAQGPRDVWCWDFIHDRDARGGPLKWLLIGDEYTRELLAMEVDRHLTSEGVCDVFASATVRYGVPAHLRSDNGAEFIARGLGGSWSGRAWGRCTWLPVACLRRGRRGRQARGRTGTRSRSGRACGTSSCRARCLPTCGRRRSCRRGGGRSTTAVARIRRWGTGPRRSSRRR